MKSPQKEEVAVHVSRGNHPSVSVFLPNEPSQSEGSRRMRARLVGGLLFAYRGKFKMTRHENGNILSLQLDPEPKLFLQVLRFARSLRDNLRVKVRTEWAAEIAKVA